MYHFAVVVFLALATLKVVDLLEEYVPGLARIHTLLTFGLAVAAVEALDYSLFRYYGISVRDHWMGPAATGLIIGSMTTAWRVVFGWLGSSELKTPGEHKPGRPRVAA